MTQTHRQPAAPPAPLMAGWISRLNLALELGLSVDTLRRWDDLSRLVQALDPS